MSNHLPARRPPSELAREGDRLPPYGPLERSEDPAALPALPDRGGGPIVPVHIGENHGTVNVTINTFQAPVTQTITEVCTVDVQKTRIDSHLTSATAVTLVPQPAYATAPSGPGFEVDRDGVLGALGCLVAAFLLFVAFIFVMAGAYRVLLAPPAPPTVVVPVAGPDDRLRPRSFLDDVTAEGAREP